MDLEKRGKIGRYRRLKATLGKLQDFADAPLPFDRITPRLLTDWETHLLEKGNKQSTIATNFPRSQDARQPSYPGRHP